MKAALIALTLLLACGATLAKAPSPTTEQEITHLFATLRASDCEFFRNGSWYNAEKANDHLQGKYKSLLKKGLITNAESFIALAASKSSMSGNAYEVRCGTAAPVASQTWFTQELNALRDGLKR